MEIIYLNDCFYTALNQGEITALITDELAQDIKSGDQIRIQKLEPPMYRTYMVTNIKRIRVDEITKEMMQKLGYVSKEILIKQMGLHNIKKLYYYIEVQDEYNYSSQKIEE